MHGFPNLLLRRLCSHKECGQSTASLLWVKRLIAPFSQGTKKIYTVDLAQISLILKALVMLMSVP